MLWYVYLLKSLKDNKYYIGQTDNVEQRLLVHNKGLVRSTKSRAPFIIAGTKSFNSQKEARWFEYQVKNHSDKRKKFLKEVLGRWLSGRASS